MNNSDFTCSYTNNTNPTDTAKVTITALATSNYTGYKDTTFTINPRITFNSNGGSGTMKNQFASYNENTVLIQNVYTRTGYIFGGWASSQSDADNRTIAYEDKGTVKLTSNITLYAIWIPDNYEITKYTVDDNNICDVSPKTTLSEFKEHIILNSTGSVKIYDKNEDEISEENYNICTGMTIKIFLAERTVTFSIIVTGDVDGNGIIDIQDLLDVNKHRLRKIALEGVYLKAGDINKDNSINVIDLLQLNKFRLGKLSL